MDRHAGGARLRRDARGNHVIAAGMAAMSTKFREQGGELCVSESGVKREAID
jgi:hypothetical protein